MARLRILIVTRLFPNSARPALGTFCLERARALARHADVRVLSPVPWYPAGAPGPEEWRAWASVERTGNTDCGIPVAYPRYPSLPKVATWAQGPALARAVQKGLEEHHPGWIPDVVEGYFAFPDGYGAVRLAQALDRPSVVTTLGSDLRLYPRLPMARTMVRWTMRTADRVVSVSSDLRDKSIALGTPPERAAFLTSGVDPLVFRLRTKEECRARLRLPPGRHIAAYVGFLVDRKDQSLVLRAQAELRRRGRPVPLVALVGDGPNRARLEREVSALGLHDDVVFAGRQPHAEVAWWMGAADYLVLSSDYEGWATVYFEAMACGRPVISSRVPSATDAIRGPEHGLVVDPRTPQAFADAFERARGTDWHPTPLRAWAEQHSWERWTERALELIEEARAEHRGRGSPSVGRVALGSVKVGGGESPA
jgi:glycosyltransferase involved in cell wall biosynthesis